MSDKQPAVYILTNKRNGTLYTGVTSNLRRRIWQHKNGIFEGFTKQYHLRDLVYFELYEDMLTAIAREKAIKQRKRKWKLGLIEQDNPGWEDLYSYL